MLSSHSKETFDATKMMREKLNILVFAYVFPPDAGSGTYRTLYFANQWAKQGDRVIILSVKEKCFLETALIDYELCKDVHPAINMVRASVSRPLKRLIAIKNTFRKLGKRNHQKPAYPINSAHDSQSMAGSRGVFGFFKDTLTDLLSCPDEHSGWIFDAVRRSMQIARSTRIDCIYATGGPWSAFLAALVLHKLKKIPLVLDFRDPWASNPNIVLKSLLSQLIQKKMEAVCVTAASAIITNTEDLRRDFIERYKNIPPSRFVTITNGFEEVLPNHHTDSDRFSIVHAGALYQPRDPFPFLQAVCEVIEKGLIPAGVLHVHLIGWEPGASEMMKLEPYLKALGRILEVTPRVTHGAALTLQQRASVLLLIQTGFPLQIPRKLYEYLALERPILCIAEAGSATARLVADLQTGAVIDNDVEQIKRTICQFYDDWRSGKAFVRNQEKIQHYSNRYLANQLREILCKFTSDREPQ